MSRALGRYELVRPLARGGMAEVFLARRRAGGVEKLLVIKRIRAERAGDARFLELFVREARLSMSLAHQNIVPVFDFGRAGDQVFLAMERVEGKDLGASLARASLAQPMPSIVAAFIAAECCQALDYAHRRTREGGGELGVVHRDVTPRNVLLSWSGEVKLTDFGIAALAGDDTSKVAGTPAYMAPEQARGEVVDARADVYAVGLVLREALTGERARSGSARGLPAGQSGAEDRDRMLEAARSGTLAPWPAHAPPWPPALVTIVDRATAHDPAARYPDARTMLAALDSAMVAERAAHPGESPPRQLATWLETLWAGERDDATVSGELEGGELLSFLDDGAAGTGTERSIAATVGSMIEPAPPPVPGQALAPLPPPASAVRGNRSRRYLLVAFALGALLIVVASATRGVRREAATRAPDAALTQLDAGRALDALVVVRIDAALDAPPVDAPAPVRDAPLRDRPLRTDAGVRTPVTPPAITVRKVRINAKPWALFTVDGGSTEYETISTVELAPGPHRIRFVNPTLKVTRDVTIVVPADRDLDHVEDLQR